MSTNKTISIVSVCYNEEANIRAMYDRIKAVFKPLNYDFELIYVDNGSQDESEKIFKKLASEDKRVKVVLMSVNSGSSQYSFLAGMKLATGDATVLIDGDIQDPPEIIPKLIEKWELGHGVVYGVRKKRKGSLFRRFLYKLFYRVFKKLSYNDIPLDAGDFSLLDKKAVKKLISFPERDYYIRGLRPLVGFNQTGVEYVRDDRSGGKTVTTLFSYLWFAKTLIINFSLKPLEWIAKLAFVFMFGAFLLIIFQVVGYYIHPNAAPGIPTIIVLVLFMGGIQLLCLSIIAEYLAKIFIEIKQRPRYIVKEILNDQNSLEKISE